jgi:hypothetical protein
VTAVTVFVVWPNTAEKYKPPPSSGEEAPIIEDTPEPPTVGLSKAAEAAALRTATNFVKTAVLRRHVADSWQLTTPSLRQGATRKEWNTGNIPVVQFPAPAFKEAKWRVGHSYQDDLELEVLLLPKQGKAGQGLGPITLVLDLITVGGASRKHWLVDAWRPYGLSQPPLSATANAATEGASSKLSAYWLFIPAGLFVFLALLPFGLIIRTWRADKRAERAYRAYRERNA